MKVATVTETDDGFSIDVEDHDHPRATMDELLNDVKVLFGEDATVSDGSVVVGDPPVETPPATATPTSPTPPEVPPAVAPGLPSEPPTQE